MKHGSKIALPTSSRDARVHPPTSFTNLYCAIIAIFSLRLIYIIAQPGISSISPLLLNDRQTQILQAYRSSRSSETPKETDYKLALLMSFPNSGTTYTLDLMNSITNYYTADVYGAASTANAAGEIVPVFEYSPEGPFWDHKLDSHEPLTYPPPGYILTKTHCGAPCVDCPPARYMTNQEKFQSACFRGKTAKAIAQFHETLVHKTIHLVRNPFDNIVARFHYTIKKDKQVVWARNQEAFRSFCLNYLQNYNAEEESHPGLDKEVLRSIRGVPCHMDFIKYIRWHNFAHMTTKKLAVETMLLHYENYESNFRETVLEIADFLLYDVTNQPADFVTGKSYVHYYSASEILIIRDAFKKLSTSDTWRSVERYFDVPDALESSAPKKEPWIDTKSDERKKILTIFETENI